MGDEMNNPKYDNKEKCNACDGENALSVKSFDGGHISECKTRCLSCKREDYWAYGFYEAGPATSFWVRVKLFFNGFFN